MSYPTLIKVAFVILISILAACSTSDEQGTTGPSASKGDDLQGKGGGNPSTPAVVTNAALYLTSQSATVSGSVNTGGRFITQRGICYSTSTNPTTANSVVVNGSGEGSYACILFGLSSNTTYYARAFAVHSKNGTLYGDNVSFTTKQSYGSVTDADGNVYATITIGDQVWTVENLRTTKYSDGSSIVNETDSVNWLGLTTGAYCNYQNSESGVSTYGRLYNWYAVTDTRGLAPDGWHVATEEEWEELGTYLGGHTVAGGRLKSVGTTLWSAPNDGASNAACFFGVPTGARHVYMTTNGTVAMFRERGRIAPFWTSTSISDTTSISFELSWNSADIHRQNYGNHLPLSNRNGYAVRLVKDP